MSRADTQAGFLAAYDAMLARWPVPVETIDLPSRFGTTRVNACGPADGPPLVLLPGGGATSTVWYANVGALSRTHRVYAIDAIGDRGRTVYDREPIQKLADLMSWFDSCLTGLNIVRAHLCGHSYGAWIVTRYALHKPHRVDRLALLDPTQVFTGQRAGYLLHAAPLLMAPGRATKRRFFTWETGGTIDPDFLEFLCRPYTVDSPAGATFIFPRRPGDAELRGLRNPVLVLGAENGQQNDLARMTATARRLLPNVTVDTLPGATHHSIPNGDADNINQRILEFLG